jgi:putative ABC transport system substrate-binding protein
MQRREFIIVFGAAAVSSMSSTLPLHAQQPRSLPLVGFLSSAPIVGSVNLVRAFRQGLADSGLVETRDFFIEYRWAVNNQIDQLPAFAADFVRRQAAVIAANDAASATAAQAASTTTPVVLVTSQGSNEDSYRAAGLAVGRILKGEKLTDPPVAQPAK